MKKVLSILSLIAVLGVTPAFAAPMQAVAHGGPGGPGGPGGHGRPMQTAPMHNQVHRPPHHGGPHVPPPPPRRVYYSGGSAIVGGVLARRSCWGDPYCNYYRLGWYDDFYFPPAPPHYRGSGIYVNFGIPIRF